MKGFDHDRHYTHAAHILRRSCGSSTVTLSLFYLPTATAASPDEHSGVCPVGEAAPVELIPVSDEVSKELSQHTQDLQERSAITVATDPSSLAYNRSIVYQVETTQGTGYSATVPIDGSHFMSNFTVLYGPHMEFLSYSETHIRQVTGGNVHIEQWTNGEKSQDRTVSIESQSNSNTPPGATTKSWGKAVGCVATTLGVGAGVAKIILALCATSCAVPEPTFSKGVCVACIGGIATVGGGAVAAVVKCFGYW
ncbi:hypothetical protein [Cutibacterium sp.]|uniref:hypothetical protein n=1 Tax=Cutibacterium sp. TaxID=1912221 RepID=UPI0026DAD068|nr:hypothetical protein [Cutibacterium sp.]MDO4411532.1 hypothetical protein [Cutibacterium sp.]